MNLDVFICESNIARFHILLVLIDSSYCCKYFFSEALEVLVISRYFGFILTLTISSLIYSFIVHKAAKCIYSE